MRASRPAVAYRAAARGVLAQLGAAPPKRKGAVRDFVRADMRSSLQSLRRTAGGVAQAGIGSVGSMPSRPVRSSSSSCSARCDAMSPPANSTAIS